MASIFAWLINYLIKINNFMEGGHLKFGWCIGLDINLANFNLENWWAYY